MLRLLALSLVLACDSARRPCRRSGWDAWPRTAFRARIEPLVAQSCVDCHSGDEPAGELAHGRRCSSGARCNEDRETWDKMARRVRDNEMPPEDGEPLETAQREQFLKWVDAELAKDDCGGPRDPGRVTIRRLNRNEYNNTIRDLLGVDFQPAKDFPADDVGYGFDNIGDVLSMPPILLEKYLAAAQDIVDHAVGHAADEPGRRTSTAAKKSGRRLSRAGLPRRSDRQGQDARRRKALHPARAGLWRSGGRRAGEDADFARRQARCANSKCAPWPTIRELYEAWVEVPEDGHGTSGRSAFLNDYYRPDDGRAARPQSVRRQPGNDGPLSRDATSRSSRASTRPRIGNWWRARS